MHNRFFSSSWHHFVFSFWPPATPSCSQTERLQIWAVWHFVNRTNAICRPKCGPNAVGGPTWACTACLDHGDQVGLKGWDSLRPWISTCHAMYCWIIWIFWIIVVNYWKEHCNHHPLNLYSIFSNSKTYMNSFQGWCPALASLAQIPALAVCLGFYLRNILHILCEPCKDSFH
jgi:hypothetical protein